MKRGRDSVGWKVDSRRRSLSGQPKKKKTGTNDIISEDWLNGKTVKVLALTERVLPKEFVWDVDETK